MSPDRSRKVVLIVGVVEALVLLAFVGLLQGSSDPLAKAIASGMSKAAMIPLFGLVIPAIALGLANRLLVFAALLLLLAIPVSALIWFLV